MPKSLAEVWLTTHRHGLFEHLRGKYNRGVEPLNDPNMVADPRAEDLLLGLLRFNVGARAAVERTGLQVSHFTQRKARLAWEGQPDDTYRICIVNEYDQAAREIEDIWCKLRFVHGAPAELYEASSTEVAVALAGRIVALAKARDSLREASTWLGKSMSGESAGMGGVQL